MDPWDVELASAVLLHFVFTDGAAVSTANPDSIFNLQSEVAEHKQKTLRAFVSLMCASYPNITCRDSWCRLFQQLPDLIEVRV